MRPDDISKRHTTLLTCAFVTLLKDTRRCSVSALDRITRSLPPPGCGSPTKVFEAANIPERCRALSCCGSVMPGIARVPQLGLKCWLPVAFPPPYPSRWPLCITPFPRHCLVSFFLYCPQEPSRDIRCCQALLTRKKRHTHHTPYDFVHPVTVLACADTHTSYYHKTYICLCKYKKTFFNDTYLHQHLQLSNISQQLKHAKTTALLRVYAANQFPCFGYLGNGVEFAPVTLVF